MTALSALGLVLSLCFVVLLLVPGLPGCLNAPAYAMLAVWVVTGLAFYMSRSRSIK
jgi:hypothetical protein